MLRRSRNRGISNVQDKWRQMARVRRLGVGECVVWGVGRMLCLRLPD